MTLLQERGVSHAQLGALIGKSQAYVSRVLGILHLPRRVLADYPANRHVPVSAMMIIAEAKGIDLQLALWEQAKAGSSVRALTEARQATVAATALTVAESHATQTTEKTAGGAGEGQGTAALLRSLRKSAAALRRLQESGAGVSAEQTAALRAVLQEIDALLPAAH
jgi:ParB family chromosome partitioning protein